MLDRRMFLGGAAMALASPALGAQKASRTFRIIRDGDEVTGIADMYIPELLVHLTPSL